MKIKQFDVVELKDKDKDKAIIKKVISKKKYLIQIIKQNEVQERYITNKDINKVVYSKEKQR